MEIADLPRPTPAAGHVLVAVKAAALNHLDLWVRRGLPGLELQLPHLGGSDMAGTVEELGEGVDGLEVGARVLINPSLRCGRCEWCRRGEESLCTSYHIIGEHVPGGLAEFVAVPAPNVLPIPEDLTFEEAAAVPLVFQTAWRGLISRGNLEGGESVLVLGGSGGVSTAAIQIAKLVGARVFAVTSGAEKVRRVKELGADVVVDRLKSEFAREVWKASNKRGVDLVFDGVGEAVWEGAIRSLAPNGRLVTYGATTGPRGANDIRGVFWKQLQIIGTTMANQSEFERVMALIFRKKLKPVIDVVWPLDQVREAHERLEAGQQFGKIVLKVA